MHYAIRHIQNLPQHILYYNRPRILSPIHCPVFNGNFFRRAIVIIHKILCFREKKITSKEPNNILNYYVNKKKDSSQKKFPQKKLLRKQMYLLG